MNATAEELLDLRTLVPGVPPTENGTKRAKPESSEGSPSSDLSGPLPPLPAPPLPVSSPHTWRNSVGTQAVQQALSPVGIVQGVLILLFAGLVLYAASTLNKLSEAVIELKGSQVAMSQKLDVQSRLNGLERTAQKRELEVRITSMENDVHTLLAQDNKQWPRLRALDAATKVLKSSIMNHHPDARISLPITEKF